SFAVILTVPLAIFLIFYVLAVLYSRYHHVEPDRTLREKIVMLFLAARIVNFTIGILGCILLLVLTLLSLITGVGTIRERSKRKIRELHSCRIYFISCVVIWAILTFGQCFPGGTGTDIVSTLLTIGLLRVFHDRSTHLKNVWRTLFFTFVYILVFLALVEFLLTFQTDLTRPITSASMNLVTMLILIIGLGIHGFCEAFSKAYEENAEGDSNISVHSCDGDVEEEQGVDNDEEIIMVW
ncbi:unnamed protein product, partial [Allacma fusca]